jgi:hypothetical protein
VRRITILRPLAVLLALVGTLVACGGDQGAARSPGAPAEKAGEGGGPDAPSIRFVSARNHYRIDAVGTMTESSDGTASSGFGQESLKITVVSTTSAGDPTGFAKSDLESLRATSGFTLKSGPERFRLNASDATVKTVYSLSGVTSPVTGKPQTFVSVRYYIPRNSGTLAVVTYSDVIDQYDPSNADDVANTFAWQ